MLFTIKMLFITFCLGISIFLYKRKYPYKIIALVDLFLDKLDASAVKLLNINSHNINNVWHRILYHTNKNKKINILTDCLEIYKCIYNLKVIIKFDNHVNAEFLRKKIPTNLPHGTTHLELYSEVFCGHFKNNTIIKTYYFDNDFSNLPPTIKKIKFSANKFNKIRKQEIYSIVLPSNIKLPFDCEIEIDKLFFNKM